MPVGGDNECGDFCLGGSVVGIAAFFVLLWICLYFSGNRKRDAPTETGVMLVTEHAYKRMSNQSEDAEGLSPILVPLSGRYRAVLTEPGFEDNRFYVLEFRENGSLEGECTVGDTKFYVSGQYNQQGEVYQWGEAIDNAFYASSKNATEYCNGIMQVSRQFIDAPGHTEVYVSVVDAMKGILEGRFYKTSGGNGTIYMKHVDESEGSLV